MEPSQYVGRKVSKQVVKSLLAAAFGKTSVQGTDGAVPRLFIFYGTDGSGKSAFTDLCRQCVTELGATNGRQAASVLLDLDGERFRTGALPHTPAAMVDALSRTAAAGHERIASQLAPFERTRLKIDDILWKKQHLIDTEWPRELFLGNQPAESGGSAAAKSTAPATVEERFIAWIETKIDPADLALASSADGSRTALLADCLINASLKMPFALIIDGLARADVSVVNWLRDAFLPLIVNRDSGLAIILTGSDALARSFRNAFAERSVYACPLASLSLTLPDIAECALARSITLTPVQVAQIELATTGHPLAVQALLDYAAMKIPLGDTLPDQAETEASDLLLDRLADHFLQKSDDAARMRVFSLALCYRADADFLAKFWEMPLREVSRVITDLAGRYSFILHHGRLHEAFRDRFRRFLIAGIAQGGDSALSGFLKTFTELHTLSSAAAVKNCASKLPDPVERYANQEFQAAILSCRYSLALTSPHELLKALPGLFIEALLYNRAFAARLLEFEKELEPLLPHDLQSMTAQLRAGLSIADDVVAPIMPGSRGTAQSMGFMENFQSALDQTGRALLHRLRGKLQGHAGNFLKAVEELEAAAKLLPEGTPARNALFGDFTAAGYAFIKSGDTGRAIAAFARAVTLRADDLAAWIELARLQQSAGDHPAAIASLEAAVAIDPDSGEVWLELGRECARTANHARAVEAFARVVKLDPRNTQAWYHSALSLEALSKFSEAQTAAGKVVAMVPDHWEALLILGRVLAAQYYSREAIDAFNKVVAIRPDCREAWEALGKRLLAVEAYEEAAVALEKAAGLDGASPELWHAIGTAWYGAANYRKTVDACRKATLLKGDFFDAWVTLGHGLSGMKDFKGAAAAFQAAADLNPVDRQVWVNVGESRYNQGEFQAAIDAFMKATGLRADTDTVWLSIGRAFQAQKKYTEAVDSFQKSITINPNAPDAWFEQGRSYAMLGWHDDAAASFTKAIELAPDAGDAWYQRGLALAATGKNDDAIASFAKAAETLSTDADVWFQLGLARMATGGEEEAAGAFLRSIDCDGKQPDAFYQLGLAREALGNYEEAISSFQQALRLSPDRQDALLRLGICCNTLGRYAEAADSLRKVREIDPGNKEALLPLALSSHALGNYDDAVDLYRKVVAIDPESEEARYNMALALHATGNFNEAFEAYLDVVRQWPAKDEAWYNLGLAYNAVQDYPQAISAFREASRLNPDSSDIWFELGTVYYATEQYGEAILSFRKVITRNPAMFEAWYNLGNAYLIWGEFTEAIAAYKKAAELKPGEYSVWGCLCSACYASGAFVDAVAAGDRAFALKDDEPWIVGTLGLSKLLSGDAAGAMPLFERLLVVDTAGREIERIAAELKKTLALRPSLAGANEALRKLNAGMLLPPSNP
jgi:tetratricopeptide (TPR) repeat protein